MTKQLPPRSNLEQLRKQAKALLRDLKASDPEALRRIRKYNPRYSAAGFTLAAAQLTIAREYGFKNWSALRTHVLSHPAAPDEGEALTALLTAAMNGDAARAAELLDAHPGIINERGGPGTRTALHFAAMSRQEPVVQLLLDRGADPDIRCEGDSAAPLHFAAEQEHFGIIRLLIEYGADPIGEGDYHELEIIGWATCFASGKRDIVDYLTAHGSQHNIFSAVAMGEVKIIRSLVVQSRDNLEKRMDLTNKRRRPLHLAVVKKQPESLAALLELGAATESLDEAGFTALDQAALNGETAMAQLLLDGGAELRLPAAVALQRTRELEALLRKDPDCLKPSNRWGTLIVRAAESAPGPVIESLIKAGASVDVWDDPKTAVDSTSGYTPLHAAAFHGNFAAAAVLLQHGADVRLRDKRYQGTPAGWAAFAGHNDTRDLILQGLIDIFEAIEMGRADRIPGILAREPAAIHHTFSEYLHGSSESARPAQSFIPGVRRDGSYTPLAFAQATGNDEAVRLLLSHRA